MKLSAIFVGFKVGGLSMNLLSINFDTREKFKLKRKSKNDISEKQQD